MHCWARYLLIAVISLFGIGQMIAACGQKGDLYLPEPEEKAAGKKATGAQADPPPQVPTGDQPDKGEGAAADTRTEPPGQ